MRFVSFTTAIIISKEQGKENELFHINLMLYLCMHNIHIWRRQNHHHRRYHHHHHHCCCCSSTWFTIHNTTFPHVSVYKINLHNIARQKINVIFCWATLHCSCYQACRLVDKSALFVFSVFFCLKWNENSMCIFLRAMMTMITSILLLQLTIITTFSIGKGETLFTLLFPFPFCFVLQTSRIQSRQMPSYICNGKEFFRLESYKKWLLLYS